MNMIGGCDGWIVILPRLDGEPDLLVSSLHGRTASVYLGGQQPQNEETKVSYRGCTAR